jgi:uncharacterized membrane protein YfcA
MNQNHILIFFILTLANTVETFTGFGNTIIALSLGTFLMSVPELIALILPVNQILSLYIAIRHYEELDGKLFIKKVLPLMLVGLFVGVFFGITFSSLFKTDFGLKLFMLFVLVTATLEIFKFEKITHIIPAGVWMFLGGIIHGLFSTGGPFAVLAINRWETKKEVIRTTLTYLWLILNSILVGVYLFHEFITLETLKLSALYSLNLFIAIPLGNFLLKKVPANKFKLITNVLLILISLKKLFG